MGQKKEDAEPESQKFHYKQKVKHILRETKMKVHPERLT